MSADFVVSVHFVKIKSSDAVWGITLLEKMDVTDEWLLFHPFCNLLTWLNRNDILWMKHMLHPKGRMTMNSRKLEILKQNNAEANAIARESIEKALILLMKEKEFSDISITDITKRAGVSRVTYYRNYSSKEDILSGYLQNVVTDFYLALKDYDAVTQTRELWVTLFEKMKEHSQEIILLMKAGYGDELLNSYIRGINAGISGPEENPELYYSNCYWVGALHSMTKEWIRGGMKESIDQMVYIGTAMMTSGIRTIDEFGNRCE